MRELVKKEWSELSNVWNELFDHNPTATPFQSYAFLSATGKGKPQRKDMFRMIGLHELNLVLYKDQVPIAIAPLLYKTKKGKTTVYLRGHFTAVNQLDFIYASLSYDDFAFLMDGIQRLLGDVSFYFDWINHQSPTSAYLKKYLPSAIIHEIKCYAIPVPQTYDDWYQSLHKSVRRQIRKSQNRIAADNIECTTSFFVKETIDPSTYKEMMMVYADRFLIKNKIDFGPFQSIVRKLLQGFLLRDKMTQWLNRANLSYHVVVHMNHEIAAFASGIICKNKRIISNRLAIYTKYARYNPGAILLSSVISHLTEQRKTGGIDIDTFDMSQGGLGGMAYKIAFGGDVYTNYIFH